ncbi:MAG: extracellular solute-binding protein, partial [Eubacteriales bacterium]|nr:extracellular solute-binding protein [Eubacteriales bacterium]
MNINKKTMSLLCLIVTAAMLMCFACKEKTEPEAGPVTARVTNVYRTEFLTLPENYNSTNNIFVSGERLYILCMEIIDTENYTSQPVLYSLDLNGENPESEVLVPSSENTHIQQFALSSDGSRVFIESSYDPDTQSQTFLLTKTSADGSLVFSEDAQDMFPDTAADPVYGGMPWFNIGSMAVGGDGIIYLASDAAIVAVSPEGDKLFDIAVNGNIRELNAAADGRVLAGFYDWSGSGGGMTLKYIDTQKKDFGETAKLPESLALNNYDTYIGPGYDFYLKDQTSVYGCDKDSAEPVELLNFINSDINPNSVQSLIISDVDHFIYTGYDNVTYEQQIAFLSRVPDSEVTEKFLINLACIYLDYNLVSYVVKFNQTNDTYRVVINDYSKYNTQEDYQLAQTTLQNEIIAGKIPDILLIGYGLDADSLADKGVFCDLYGFLDNDEDISREDLLGCVTTPFEDDGKLYKLVTSFNVQTLTGKKANIGDAASWTIDEMLAVSEKAGEGAVLFENMSKSMMLNQMFMLGSDSFIDYTTGSCSFDSESFIKLLEYCNTLPDDTDFLGPSGRMAYEEVDDRYVGYREDKTLLYNTYLTSFSNYLQTRFIFGFEEINMIGYPTSQG